MVLTCVGSKASNYNVNYFVYIEGKFFFHQQSAVSDLYCEAHFQAIASNDPGTTLNCSWSKPLCTKLYIPTPDAQPFSVFNSIFLCFRDIKVAENRKYTELNHLKYLFAVWSHFFSFPNYD